MPPDCPLHICPGFKMIESRTRYTTHSERIQYHRTGARTPVNRFKMDGRMRISGVWRNWKHFWKRKSKGASVCEDRGKHGQKLRTRMKQPISPISRLTHLFCVITCSLSLKRRLELCVDGVLSPNSVRLSRLPKENQTWRARWNSAQGWHRARRCQTRCCWW